MPSLNTYHLFGFLLPWACSIFSQLLQQSTATAPYLDEGYLLTTAVPDLQRGIAPLGLLCLCSHCSSVAPPSHQPWPQAWVASPSCRPWPRAQGGSSGSPPLALGARWLLLAASDLGCGEAPPSSACGATQDCGSWWRGLTERGPLEKGTASHFSILALRPHEQYEKAK